MGGTRPEAEEKPVPDDYRNQLTDLQYLRLESMRVKGWEVKLVRSSLFQVPLCVVQNPDDKKLAVIEPEGTVHLIDKYGTYLSEEYQPDEEDES